jgi:RNA polymerase sigma factor (sigma-70 family)
VSRVASFTQAGLLRLAYQADCRENLIVAADGESGARQHAEDVQPALGAAAVGLALSPELAGGFELMAIRALGAGDHVADVVQEILARTVAAVRSGRLDGGVPLAAFACGIARHVIADAQRARHRARSHDGDADLLAAPEPSALERLVADEERARLARALATLAPDDRALLAACYVNGERLADLAARSGEPPERVRKRKSRALARLREVLMRLEGHAATPQPMSE